MVAKNAKLDKYKVIHRPESTGGFDLGSLLGGREEDTDIFAPTVGSDPAGELIAGLESKLIGLLQEQGFRGDSTRLLLRSIDLSGKQAPKAWALLGEELKIKQ
jgi:hypothetical protein